MIEFKDVTKTFGPIVAVSDINFKVKEGEFAFITGPSGAGKTTIIRLVLRDIEPDKGEILFGSKNIARLSKKEIPLFRREIGVVFQDFKFISTGTVFENVAVPLAVRGLPVKERNARVNLVLEKVGIKDRANLFPSQLAGGELQRAVLARAIVGKPKIVLADEPTGNLDRDTGWQIVKLLEEINKEGTTVVMATHNIEIVKRTKYRIIELDRGKIVADKKIDD